MTRLAVIGPGRLGSALGVVLSERGHEVRFAGGSDRSRAAAVAGADASSQSRSIEDAAAWAEVVTLAVPFAALGGALGSCGDLSGKIVWSCVNALRADMSGLEIGFDSSAAERVAQLARGAQVVGAIPPFAEILSSPSLDFTGQTPSVFCCGDHAHAKAIVADLVRDLGADPVDVGPLTIARYVEPALMMLISQAYSSDPPRTLALKLLERDAAMNRGQIPSRRSAVDIESRSRSARGRGAQR